MAFPIRHYWEMVKDLEERHDRYMAALEEIEAILGPPCDDNACGGCGHEMADAAAIVKKALHGSEKVRCGQFDHTPSDCPRCKQMTEERENFG